MRILEPVEYPIYDWRDPDMKVLWFGFIKGTRTSVVMEATAEERQEYCRKQLAIADSRPQLDWRNDPSYHWSKKKWATK